MFNGEGPTGNDQQMKRSSGLLRTTGGVSPGLPAINFIVTHFCGQSGAGFNASIPALPFCMTNCFNKHIRGHNKVIIILAVTLYHCS